MPLAHKLARTPAGEGLQPRSRTEFAAGATQAPRIACSGVSLLHALAIFGAGIAAGTINTVVGSGTLITFPVLLGFGYSPRIIAVALTAGFNGRDRDVIWG